MTENHKKDVKSVNIINPVMAGVAGIVAGGLTVAAAIIMSDKKNQKKVKDVLIEAKEKVVDYVETIKSQPIIETKTAKLKAVNVMK